MTNQTMGLLLGGLLPALMYGVFPVLVKMGNTHHLTPGNLLLFGGIAIALLGVLYGLCFENAPIGGSPKAALFGFLSGLAWGIGTLGVGYAIAVLGSPIALITPVFNTNTLVAVILGLMLFSEWKTLQVSWLVTGSVLIVIGGVIVSRA